MGPFIRYYAMRALRIEKFYAFWGQDLDSQSTPLECGRMFRCKMGKDDPDFIGKGTQSSVCKYSPRGRTLVIRIFFHPLYCNNAYIVYWIEIAAIGHLDMHLADKFQSLSRRSTIY